MKPKYKKKKQILFIFAGLLHCLGTLIMNFMLTLSDIPCVHTIRALEPLIACILVCFIPMPNKNQRNSEDLKINNIEKWIGTILMLFGVVLATWRSDQCNVLSTIFFLGVLTNLLMVSRNICIQHISVENDEIFSQIILYGISTLLSFLLLIISNFSRLVFEKYGTLLFLIGLCSFIYNSTSIMVCNRVQLVSHSILTMLKRPTIILASVIYFNSDISLMMIIGNLIILIGILLYKINIIILLFISRRKIFFLILSLTLIFSMIIIFSSMSYTNLNGSLHIKIVNKNKDFPLFYWKPSGIHDNFGDKLSHVLVKSIVGWNISVITGNQPGLFCKKTKLLAIGSVFSICMSK